jgi:hypothetical protein
MAYSDWQRYAQPTSTIALQPHEQQSPFFHLPAETRLMIYENLLPSNGRIDIDLCTLPKSSDGRPKRSICSNVLEQVHIIHETVNGNGLQLLVSPYSSVSLRYSTLSRIFSRLFAVRLSFVFSTVVFFAQRTTRCFQDTKAWPRRVISMSPLILLTKALSLTDAIASVPAHSGGSLSHALADDKSIPLPQMFREAVATDLTWPRHRS